MEDLIIWFVGGIAKFLWALYSGCWKIILFGRWVDEFDLWLELAIRIFLAFWFVGAHLAGIFGSPGRGELSDHQRIVRMSNSANTTWHVRRLFGIGN